MEEDKAVDRQLEPELAEMFLHLIGNGEVPILNLICYSELSCNPTLPNYLQAFSKSATSIIILGPSSRN